MAEHRLTLDDVNGIFGIMPTPATTEGHRVDAEFTVDLEETERAARAMEEDGSDAIMINGTFGEAPTLTLEEWQEFTRTVVETVEDIPVIAGPTTLDTRTTIERAKFARDVGADGILLGRPMWCKMSAEAIVQFHKDVAEAVPELGIVAYDNPLAFKGRIAPSTWEQLAEIPQIVAAKYAFLLEEDKYTEVLEAVDEQIHILPMDRNWHRVRSWFPDQIPACWSPMVPCDPLPLVLLREAIEDGDDERAEELTDRMIAANETFMPEDKDVWRCYNIPLEKIRINAAGYMESGPSRPPYHAMPEGTGDGARKSGQRWQELVEDLS